MSSNNMKCNACGSTDIDVDPSRADAVCTNCGNVLESSIIVSDIQFEENTHGGSSAVGTFVSNEQKGGGTFSLGGGGGRGFGSSFGPGLVRESREITLKNARRKIEALAHQLSLRRDRIDMAFHFFKLALNKHLTRGRKSSHVIAACVYITCRTESTPHMLIDFSDILQIDVYELGRTYLRLSQALCINIPAMDPCVYVMRFAHRLELGDKTHDVSMTALRLVSRMKKDWIHFGRRPSGLCGAALLIAARMHGYSRSVYDVIKVVKVHESTLRKRLNEFGETPASQLTLDEFMNIDLEAMTEEQDPPSFKAARKRDRERMNKLETETDIDLEYNELESKIEDALDEVRMKLHKRGSMAKMFKDRIENRKKEKEEGGSSEDVQAEEFIASETLGAIDALVNNSKDQIDSILMPPPGIQRQKAPVGVVLKDTIQEYLTPSAPAENADGDPNSATGSSTKEDEEDEELDLTGIDDTEIEGYIMTDHEIEFKTKMWLKVNAEYLKEQAIKKEKERLEEEEAIKEGREIKKKPRKSKAQVKKEKGQNPGGHQTAIEAIEKIVAEKKISTKINYDVLRSLNSPMTTPSPSTQRFDESPGSPSIYGSVPINPMSPNPNSVFSPGSPSPNSPMRRLSSFKKDRDLTLKRPQPSAIKGSPLQKRTRTLSRSSNPGSPAPPSPARSMPGSPMPPASPASPMPASPQKQVIVENGPVTPGPSEVSDIEDEDFEDEAQQEEKVLSARELLSQHNADEDDTEQGFQYEEEEEYY